MQRRGFLGAISAGLFGARLPVPAKQVLMTTSLEAKKYTSNIQIPNEMLDDEIGHIIRSRMVEALSERIDREIMG